MRRADDVRQAEQRVVLRRLDLEHVDAGAGDLAALRAPRAAPSSTTSPPRAQLMMRTPSFILAIAAGVDDVAGLVGQRRVQRDEVGAAEELVELDLLDAELGGALLRQERIEGDDLHLAGRRARSATIEPILPQPMTPSVLPVISTPMKRFFSHLPAWVEASACGNLAGQREHHARWRARRW